MAKENTRFFGSTDGQQRPDVDYTDETIASVVGVTFPNEDGSLRQEFLQKALTAKTQGDIIPICLEREPTNQYDANAVKVLFRLEGKYVQVGYVSREMSAFLTTAILNNEIGDVDLNGIGTVPGKTIVGASIRLYGKKA